MTKMETKNLIRKHTTMLLISISINMVIALTFMAVDVEAVIPSPPSMIKQPPHEQLYQVSQTIDEADRPFMLECEATGVPEPTYTWKKNGLDFDYVAYDKRISQQPRRGTLVFTKPDNVDEGLYQCFASNIHGTAMSNAVFLRRAELNSFPDQQQPDIVNVEEGKPLTVDCNPPTGYPKPSIFWIILSSTGALRSINSSRLTVDPEGRLHFSNVTRDDQLDDAVYACSATSVFRTEYKVGRRTVVSVAPSGSTGMSSYPPERQYVTPPIVPALRGQKLQLHCIFGGTPLPDIVWKKKSGNLDGNKYTYISFGKTLVIKRVEYEDEGTYECQASNGVGNQQSHAMKVTVASAPYWIASPNNTNAAEGEDVRFVCQAEGRPEPKLQWLINGKPLSEAPPNSRRQVEGNTLSITNLVKTDTAVIQCNASNVHGYAFKDFYLNVLALPPTIVEPPEKYTRAVVTSTVRIKCRVFGAPTPEVKWRRNGLEVTGGRYRVLKEGDLQITDVLVTDAGEYQCYASNKFGDIEVKGELQVKGKTRITHPPENFEVAAGKMAVFRCNAAGDPSLPLKIEWLFNGKAIDFDHDPRMVQAADNSLTITKTIELDSGRYTCVAKTDLDSDSSSATLIVQDVPNRPVIIGVDCEGFRASVEWQPTGDRRAPILSYTIQYNTSFTPDIWEDMFANIPSPDTRFTLSLSPWVNYTFRVIAINKIGPSLPSDPSGVCATEEDVPHSNPENVMGRGTTPNNLVISWTPMPQKFHNAPGFFYKVHWKRNDVLADPWKHVTITDWQQNEYIIPGQPTFKEYRIKVEAHNRRGQANVQAPDVIGYSGEDVPSQAPRNFRMRDKIIDPKSAHFSWDAVDPSSLNGFFRGYKIQTWTPDEGEERMREVRVQPNVTQAVVSIFKPFARNLVQVLAFNDRYNGPPSERIEFTMPEGVPGPVANFYVIPMGSSAFYLAWEAPEEPNGILTGYKVYYQEVRGTELGPKLERHPRIDNPQEIRAKLAGLKPGTKYRVTIHAMTAAGEGEGFYVEQMTRSADEESKPDRPEFSWTKIPDEEGLSGVRVTWLPNTGLGRPGSHFYVQYRRRGDGQWESTPMEENQDSIVVRGLDSGKMYEMRVVAVDGKYQTPSDTEEVPTGTLGMPSDESTAHFAKADWFIGLMCAIALLIVLAVLVSVVQRNRGGKYDVHEKERRHGSRDLDYDDGGFPDYHKPTDGRFRDLGSRNSVTDIPESDTDSMADSMLGDSSKFGEDGSFIGQYGTKKRISTDPQSPSGMATFV